MASQQGWIFSPRVEGNTDREKLGEDLRKLLGLGWIRTDPPNGIRKVFTFATVDDAVDFHSLLSSSTIKNQHDALLRLEGTAVSVLWTTHKPGPRGLSRLDYSMARICDTIAGALKDDQGVWEGLRTEFQVYTPPTKIFYFRYHSYVIDFVRAVGVVAKPELLLGSIQLCSTPKSVELIIRDEDIRPELAIWLEFVKESVVKSEASTDDATIEGGQRRFQFNSVGEALNFHTLVHRCFVSKGLRIESLCEGKSVAVKSPGVEDMYKCINLIADAVSGNVSSWGSLVGDDGDIPTVLHFAHHSKLAIFVRAVVIGSKSAGPLSVTSDYTAVKLTGDIKRSSDLVHWLRFVLSNVVKPDPEDKVEKCGIFL